jgi:hypothetical protein
MTEDDRAELVSYPPEEILDYTIEELVDGSDHVSFYLPYQWAKTVGSEYGGGDGIGNLCPDDPLTIYWTADVNGCDQRVSYKTTIGKLLNATFEGHELGMGTAGVIGSASVPLFVDIRDALQKEIDRLNVWISTAVQENEDD